MTKISRRGFLESSATASVCVLLGRNETIGHETPTPAGDSVGYTVSRFMMKRDYPRLEVQARDYRFVWHGRWFGFRLCGHPAEFDERISYTSFGSFQVGGVDLISTHNYTIPFKGHGTDNLGLGSGRLALPQDPDPQCPEFLLEYSDRVRIYLRFSATAPHIHMNIEPLTGKAGAHYTVPFAGYGIFCNTWQGKKSAAYFAPGAETGLCIAGAAPDDVTIQANQGVSTINCRVPADRPSTWALTALEAANWPMNDEQQHAQAPSQPTVKLSVFREVVVGELASWEKQKMDERNWHALRGAVQDRVAGIFISAPKWSHPCTKDPHGQIEYVEKVFLDEVIATGVFPAIGLSRDGIYEQRQEFDTHARWLKLVERIHAAGLVAYMKPGDGEIRRVRGSRDTLAQWACDCFAVPPEQQADVLRLPWEAMLHAWDTADLCLPHLPEWIEKPEELPRLSWPKAHKRIVTAVADRFSYLIDEVRRHSPKITVDLECGDSAVFHTLLGRHENLGVMYMCYGQYPRVCDYLDLNACVAREQLASRRVVMETDCYYTYSCPALGLLYRQPPKDMYSPTDVENIAAKHRYMNGLAVEATWAWGINLCYTREKFEAICRATGIPT